MMTDDYRSRLQAKLVDDYRLVGTVVEYHADGEHVRAIGLVVAETDIPTLKAGDEVIVKMDAPRDGNFMLRDVRGGGAGFEGVPVGGTVTFVECSLVNDREVDACGFDLPGMDLEAYNSPRM